MQNFLIKLLKPLVNKVYKQLSGMEEKHFQIALGIEFRKIKLTLCVKQVLKSFMIIIL